MNPTKPKKVARIFTLLLPLLALLIVPAAAKAQSYTPEEKSCFNMVQRKVARHWRKLKHFPATGARATEQSAVSPLESIASDDSTPSQVAAAGDLLDRMLGQLGDLDQQLVRLKLEGHSSVETAQILGKEPAFIRMRWSRLRQMLRKRDHLNE